MALRVFIISLALFLSGLPGYSQNSIPMASDSAKPFVLGLIDELRSSHLSEKRILNIYLPESYNKNDTTRYPVIYLLDGSADEDFIHVTGLVQFNTFPWIKRMPESIVVGIANTDRRRDFTFMTSIHEDRAKYPTTGHSDKFIFFIEKELQPYIDKTYRTNASKTIIGQSLGGLLATEILFNKPHLFDTYIIISPSLWWDSGSVLKPMAAILQKDFPDRKDVYIGVGNEGQAPGTQGRTMEEYAISLTEVLKSSQNKHIHLCYDYLPEEDHATVMHQAVMNAFRVLYKDDQ
jgi:predicted alpha/beta superfamily hydrolase